MVPENCVERFALVVLVALKFYSDTKPRGDISSSLSLSLSFSVVRFNGNCINNLTAYVKLIVTKLKVKILLVIAENFCGVSDGVADHTDFKVFITTL